MSDRPLVSCGMPRAEDRHQVVRYDEPQGDRLFAAACPVYRAASSDAVPGAE
jgi:hypothetical protein